MGEGQNVLQLRDGRVPVRGTTGNQRILQGQDRRHLSHLFLIRARRRHLNRHIQLPRPYPVRSPRGEGGRDGLGTAPRQVRLRLLRKGGNTFGPSSKPSFETTFRT